MPPATILDYMVGVYSLAIFCAAFLLFAVEPMLARMIVPLFGGTPVVWTIMLAFFQTALSGGYLYVFAGKRHLGVKRQALVHVLLLLLPLALLPMAVPPDTIPPVDANPAGWLLGLLTRMVALPFVLVSASSPLLQQWFSALPHRRAQDPYFLYAASNLGSLAALVSYPALIEPYLTLQNQSRLWAAGYVVLLVMVVCAAIPLRRATESAPSAAPSTSIPWGRRLYWLLLALLPVSLLSSVTTYVSTDLASIPLWWIVPLIVYLLSFILVFAEKPLWSERGGILFLAYLVPVLAFTLGKSHHLSLVLLHLGVFFLAIMFCHGALAGDRPDVAHLSEFYVWMSVGGAIGGLFNALVAPLLFDTIAEYPLSLILVLCLVLYHQAEMKRQAWLDIARVVGIAAFTAVGILLLKKQSVDAKYLNIWMMFTPLAGWLFFAWQQPPRLALAVAATFLTAGLWADPEPTSIDMQRSFFGAYRVNAVEDGRYHYLLHGTTIHGMQDTQEPQRSLLYFSRTGPIGTALSNFAKHPARPVAVVGLGVGSLACYGQKDQPWTFYEIDKLVEDIARDPRLFTYLRDCPAKSTVVIGDARLSLERAPDHSFGLIVLDAYGSDAIPVHLLTQQAVQLYLSKLAPDGALVFNSTNRNFDIARIVSRLAADAGLVAVKWSDEREVDKKNWKTKSKWILVARKSEDLLPLTEGDAVWQPLMPAPEDMLWTDDFSSVLSILRPAL